MGTQSFAKNMLLKTNYLGISFKILRDTLMSFFMVKITFSLYTVNILPRRDVTTRYWFHRSVFGARPVVGTAYFDSNLWFK